MELPTHPGSETVPFEHLSGVHLLGLDGRPAPSVRDGLPTGAFDTLRSFLGVPATDLARVLSIAPRTLSRRHQAGRLTPAESDRLLRLARLAEMAAVAFGGEEPGAAWLREPKRLLGGESPLDRADTDPGAREVEDMLYAVEFTAAA